MVQHSKFYIDGAWQEAASRKSLPVINPANEEPLYEIALGSKADVDKAVAAARRAFDAFSLTTREERAELLAKIIDVYKKRMKDVGALASAT
jgi:aldehyde dehydrogenase (NAD+)